MGRSMALDVSFPDWLEVELYKDLHLLWVSTIGEWLEISRNHCTLYADGECELRWALHP